MSDKIKVAIIGPGNIGTDLMIKILRKSGILQMGALVGIDPSSEGLHRAQRLGVATTDGGMEGLQRLPVWPEIGIVFDATSAGSHAKHAAACQAAGKIIIDLTPAAIGPYVVPCVNGDAHLDAPNVNMVTCGGQATIPIVAAVASVATVHYAEIIASIASKSAGPGTRANIDEFTETTSRAIESVGGAGKGKAIIILNPAEPPMIMRDTVFVLCSGANRAVIERAITERIAQVQTYAPGYRLKQTVQFSDFGADAPAHIPEVGTFSACTKVSVYLEVEGAAHWLPAYAGNLDIMTAAALQTAEKIAARRQMREAA